jgi:epoxide hydrolase 4
VDVLKVELFRASFFVCTTENKEEEWMEAVEHTYVETNGITLHVAQQGRKGDPLVILLHGFPEYWDGWKNQISYLANRGFRVWVPDQRGYNLSDKPQKVSDYRMDHLTNDVIGLIKASDEEKVILIGHDWGGIVAWRVARSYPNLIHKLIVINAPNDTIMGNHLMRCPQQLLKSWYMFFFQLRWLPERVVQINNWGILTKVLRGSSRKGTFTDDDLKNYQATWSRPNAIKSMLNWYRANLLSLSNQPTHLRVQVPTLLIWGAKDQFLNQELASKSIDLCDNWRLLILEESTHWVHHEEPERVNQSIFEFILE